MESLALNGGSFGRLGNRFLSKYGFFYICFLYSLLCNFSTSMSFFFVTFTKLFFENLDILVPMDNFISRGTAHFLTCKEPDYQQSLYNVLSTVSIYSDSFFVLSTILTVTVQLCGMCLLIAVNYKVMKLLYISIYKPSFSTQSQHSSITISFVTFIANLCLTFPLLQLMTDRNIEDSDIESAPKLIEVVFQNCKGQVDQWVEPYLRLTIDRLQRAETSYLKSLLIQVVRTVGVLTCCWLIPSYQFCLLN